MFISKDADGNVAAAEVTDLAPDIQAALEVLHIDSLELLTDEEMIAAGDALEPNSSAAILVWENIWARRVAQAMRDAGGVLAAFERVPHSVVQLAREATLAAAAGEEEL